MDKTSEKLLETRCFKEFYNLCLDLVGENILQPRMILIFFVLLVVSILFRQIDRLCIARRVFYLLSVTFFCDFIIEFSGYTPRRGVSG